ncbi:MAG: NAD+ synthase [Candidatus Nitrohelix vancouverensis]|uniref:Glutamine-dependent NAD(+) synthetase n=1 Tax=Candidatus Nitrohelix vancouverensis TaxID=2705534 RepID=A0A7T0C5C5_9BACT|nr:MAG: NAD+ synthase [Candidatus Nitrohelix vancouverensis]
MRIALAQMNATVGDFSGNVKKIRGYLNQAKKFRADIVVFPEMALTGYPPEDLLFRRGFVERNEKELDGLARHSKGLVALVGYVESARGSLYNAAALLADGSMKASYRKMELPNYGVFDEKRYFQKGERLLRFTYKGASIGVTICEDIWEAKGPGKALSDLGADLILNLSSSPYHKGKGQGRIAMLKRRARNYDAHIAYANLVGGQDELVFDGHSLVMDPKGHVIAEGRAFDEDMVFADISIETGRKGPNKNPDRSLVKTCRVAVPNCYKNVARPALPQRESLRLNEWEEIYQALVLGTGDYLRKNGFASAVVGLSGGVDSALTAAVAVDALGAENVAGVMMPSPYSSDHSVSDSETLARNLGLKLYSLPIAPIMKAFDKTLSGIFKGTEPGLTEENLQARIRGTLLMALSNKFGWLTLTTGNKSEVSMGYCTLYGDMAGGFAPLKDVPKTWVYALCRWRNERAGIELIPENVLTKEPSAELRPNQKDVDSLPPYASLDKVLSLFVEQDCESDDLENSGIPAGEIDRILRLVDLSEYKRRQSAPGVKITPKAFGKDRRLPLTSRYRRREK